MYLVYFEQNIAHLDRGHLQNDPKGFLGLSVIVTSLEFHVHIPGEHLQHDPRKKNYIY